VEQVNPKYSETHQELRWKTYKGLGMSVREEKWRIFLSILRTVLTAKLKRGSVERVQRETLRLGPDSKRGEKH